MKTYHTVKTSKLIDPDEDLAARRAIDACAFLTPESERMIDLALGFGTHQLSPDEIADLLNEEDDTDYDDLYAEGPSEEDLMSIEAEV